MHCPESLSIHESSVKTSLERLHSKAYPAAKITIVNKLMHK